MDSLANLIAQEKEHVETLFYHARRDWERQHLKWRHDVEEARRQGEDALPYNEPVLRTKEDISKACYVKIPLDVAQRLHALLSRKRKRT